MLLIPVTCPDCESDDITKYGKTKEGKQRCYCHNEKCNTKTFILNYSYNGCLKNIKESIVDMAVNGSGIRDTARVLKISPNTVIKTIAKKSHELENVNYSILNQLDATSSVSVIIKPAEEVELDEMWSFVQKKENQRWLWHAIDHLTGTVLAYVFGNRKDIVFEQLKSLLEPFGIKRFYSDDWGAYERKIPSENHVISKKNTQKIERKHLALRTRIKRLTRKTICFSKTEEMHDTVIGLFVNRYEFGKAI
jgi:IS1 family transposase/transposase-like protein